jgi:hypothetical protein
VQYDDPTATRQDASINLKDVLEMKGRRVVTVSAGSTGDLVKVKLSDAAQEAEALGACISS